MPGWVVVVVPDGMLSVTPPQVWGDATGRPFTTKAAADRASLLWPHGAYVVQLGQVT